MRKIVISIGLENLAFREDEARELMAVLKKYLARQFGTLDDGEFMMTDKYNEICGNISVGGAWLRRD